MATSTELFERIAADLGRRPGVSRNARGSLVVDGGSVRAMTSTGTIVVKLDPAMVGALILAGEGRHYKDQINAWIQFDPRTPAERCRELVEMSLEL